MGTAIAGGLSRTGLLRGLIDRLLDLTATPERTMSPASWRQALLLEVRQLLAVLDGEWGCGGWGDRDGRLWKLVLRRPDLAAQVDLLCEQRATARAGLEVVLAGARRGRPIHVVLAQLREVLLLLRAIDDGTHALIHEPLHADADTDADSGEAPMTFEAL